MKRLMANTSYNKPMTSEYQSIERIAIAAYHSQPEAVELGEIISRYLQSRGIEVYLCDSIYDPTLVKSIQKGHMQLLIATGGDGTMLRAGHLCATTSTPILGINFGRFGFLTEIRQDRWKEIIDRLLQGDYWIEKRMMLRAQHCRCTQENQQILSSWDVLNEVVVCRGSIVRPIQLDAWVDGHLLTSFVADGLIAATPTGSTAYALAVGGPIMPPELHNILIVPIAPHISIDRAIILAEGSQVRITARTDHQAVFSIDGQSPVSMENGDSVLVGASEHTTRFVRFQDRSYFYRNLTIHMGQNPAARKEA